MKFQETIAYGTWKGLTLVNKKETDCIFLVIWIFVTRFWYSKQRFWWWLHTN